MNETRETTIEGSVKNFSVGGLKGNTVDSKVKNGERYGLEGGKVLEASRSRISKSRDRHVKPMSQTFSSISIFGAAFSITTIDTNQPETIFI